MVAEKMTSAQTVEAECLAQEWSGAINADPDLLYKDVVEVIDVAKGAGVDKIGLMTEQIQAGK